MELKKRIEIATKKYPKLDSEIEEFFGDLAKVKNPTLSDAVRLLGGLDDNDILAFYRIWKECEEEVESREIDPIVIDGNELAIIIMALEKRVWAKGASVQEAKANLNAEMYEFFDYEKDRHEIWLVDKESYVNGMGGISYNTEGFVPVKIGSV